MTAPPLHPLPIGMRDLLPEEARARRELTQALARAAALHGYDPVIPPAFELYETLERGLGRSGAGDVLCFVEPESGEIAALRPDVTPQIARLIATRLGDRPPPIRLFYEATVVRRRAGRARPHRQIPQFGAELVGIRGHEAEIELVELLGGALRAVGLAKFALDLQDTRIVRSLVADLDAEALADVMRALGARDAAAARAAARGGPHASALGALAELTGDASVLVEARRALAGTPALPYVEELGALHAALAARDAVPRLVVDLGEVRHFDYYTGVVFHAVAPGPGEPVAAGGRYDDLLGRYGAPQPAVGFGVVLDALALALPPAEDRGRGRVVVAGAGAAADARARALRDAGLPCVVAATPAEALAHARVWGYELVIGDVCTVVATGAELPTPFDREADPASAIRDMLRAHGSK